MIMLYWREMLAFYALDLVVLGMKAPGLLGGSFSGQPEEMEEHLGPVAQDLIKRAFCGHVCPQANPARSANRAAAPRRDICRQPRLEGLMSWC